MLCCYVCIECTLALCFILFFFNDTAPTEIYTLSLHDALPICRALRHVVDRDEEAHPPARGSEPRRHGEGRPWRRGSLPDRKSTRLNSSHVEISYAVFCLKKKNKKTQ